MANQRELDIAQLDAMLEIDRLFMEWRKDFLGERDETGQDGGGPEDTNNEAPGYIGPEEATKNSA